VWRGALGRHSTFGRGERLVGRRLRVIRRVDVRRDAGTWARIIAEIPPDRRLRRAAQLLVGVILYGITAAMLVLARLGLDPWDVLHQGLSRTFGLRIGTWVIIVSFVLLLGWLPLGQRPGVGTLVNAVLVGLVVNVVLSVVPPPHALWLRVAVLVAGVLGNGLATGLYIGAGLGPGPRDGVSIAIAARGHSMRVVRTTIEATVLITGFLLGGTVGVGTLLYALAIGPTTHKTIPALAISRRRARPDETRVSGSVIPGPSAPR
jgi:uncharacterized membrane protein YczE